MPIYEYQCEACGHEFESLQKMSDEALKDCPACGKPKLKKLISAAAFRLKGAGWYETDFKNDRKKNLADSSGSGASDKPDDKSGADRKSGDKAEKKSSADTPTKSAETKKTSSSASVASSNKTSSD